MKRIKKLQLEKHVIRTLTSELDQVRGGDHRLSQKSNSNTPSCTGLPGLYSTACLPA
jgi:hypothetical protein